MLVGVRKSTYGIQNFDCERQSDTFVAQMYAFANNVLPIKEGSANWKSWLQLACSVMVHQQHSNLELQIMEHCLSVGLELQRAEDILLVAIEKFSRFTCIFEEVLILIM